MDHQDWGDWGDGEDYSGDAETADLADPDEPLAGGLGGYEEPGGEPGLDPGDHGDPGADDSPAGPTHGGFPEDDPMGAFGTDDPGDPGHVGDGDDGDAAGAAGAEPGHEFAAGPDYAADTADTEPHPETVVGADPDVDPDADWAPAEFPDQLDFAAPEPVDGYPWSDPSAVAAPGTGGDDPAHGPDATPPAQELLDYAGAEGGADPWAALVGSDDPAASSLGRWWAPGA